PPPEAKVTTPQFASDPPSTRFLFAHRARYTRQSPGLFWDVNLNSDEIAARTAAPWPGDEHEAWLKNESPEVQQALACNKPFLKKFFHEFDATFCKHPKPLDPLGGKLFRMNLGGNSTEPALVINKAKVEERLANFNEQTKQKVNSIKEKYGKKPEAHNGTTAHK
ncbi:unnamed protein product, partial [Mesorhabditis spiculigera]